MTIYYDDERDAPNAGEQAVETGHVGGSRPAPFERDGGGRFRGSGNPLGRPKKVKPKPATLAEACAAELKKPLAVVSKGKKMHLATYQVVAAKLITDVLTGPPIDRSRALRILERVGAFAALADINNAEAIEQSGNVWTPELEAKYRVLESEEWDSDSDL